MAPCSHQFRTIPVRRIPSKPCGFTISHRVFSDISEIQELSLLCFFLQIPEQQKKSVAFTSVNEYARSVINHGD